MHYYPHNISDYRAHTGHLTLAEDAVYRRLIDLYYLQEEGLPNDVKRLSKLILAPRSGKLVKQILSEFFQLDGDTWRHNRIDREIAKYRTKSEKAKASADERWRKARCERNANSSETQSESDANQEPEPRTRTKNQESKRGTRLPHEEIPDEWVQVAIDKFEFTQQNALDEFDTFHDYYIAQPGQKGVKIDWDATWRNWLRRSFSYKKQHESGRDPESFLNKYSEKPTLPDGSPNPNHWSNQ